MENDSLEGREIDYKYSVALSFAGADRGIAESIAEGLKKHGIKVFYDKYEQHELWGKNLHETLRDIYTKECRYCVLLITPDYLRRMWTIYERQQIIDRLATEHGQDSVLPVRVDGFDEEIPGLSQGIGYLSIGSSQHQVVIDTLLKKMIRPGYDVDSTDSYVRALADLRKHKEGYLEFERIFTSIKVILESFEKVIGGGDFDIHGWLGHERYWQRYAGSSLDILAQNKALNHLKDTGLITLCKFEPPDIWVGCGRWQLLWTGANDENEDEEERFLIGLWLYSDNPDDIEELMDEEASAAFFAALELSGNYAERFYRLAEERYDNLR